MKAGIDLLCMAETTTVAILGDMFELGENAAALHGEVGAYAAEKGVEIHYEEMSGGHDWNVWDAMIQKFMAWATR
jgi:UDP-N-acetylmuramyl pentapeptide synthase